MRLNAKWIWKKQKDYNTYNQTIIASKSFTLTSFTAASIKITADSYYRLFINEQWIADGPCRSWPTHYQYDKIDVTPYLHTGKNIIRIIARYYGVGDFHRICRQAGLLVQLGIKLKSGQTKSIISDESWEIYEDKAWISNTPKISHQMEPAEYYDARKENSSRKSKARILFEAQKGPWEKLNPRDVALMTKKPFSFKSFIGAKITRHPKNINICIPTIRLMHPGVIEANRNINAPFGIATLLQLRQECDFTIKPEDGMSDSVTITINGQAGRNAKYRLSKGIYIALVFFRNNFTHDKEITLELSQTSEIIFENPIKPQYENPWCFIPFFEYAYAQNDIQWRWSIEENHELQRKAAEFNKLVKRISKKVVDKKTFIDVLGNRAKCIPLDQMFVHNIGWQFLNRQVISDACKYIDNPTALIHDNADVSTVNCAHDGDIELLYDLGTQNCGYYSFELLADAGVQIDIFGIEYMGPDGKVQHTVGNCNGIRYITKQGLNRFISLKRRSGRYIFITLRDQKSPVKFRKIELIESTYPVNAAGSFSSSDFILNKIWDISAHTLKLCMEDTFTDCPLYEQTLWVGDVRNEALCAYTAFGAADIARRSIILAGQSLERYPIVGCQVPSSWDCLLPAWSFLWGISVWDYYWYTGDKKFLRYIWDKVIQNLKGAEKYTCQNGLFSGSFWNMFDWAKIDQNHKTVIHNSMFIVGAIDAAVKCAHAIDDHAHTLWLKSYRKRLCHAVNQLWDNKKKCYPDSIYEDGTISNSTCQHTHFLAILYDITGKHNFKQVVENTIKPPDDMVKAGSPFAMMYLYEALEKIGIEDKIIESIYNGYVPMLINDATTVWETFPNATNFTGDFPTRSHCHGWSAAPIYFLNRIILGIKPTLPGGEAFNISPRIDRLMYAKGSTATAKGPLSVYWEKTKDTLRLNLKIPKGVKVKFVRNETHKGLRVSFKKEFI